MARKKDDAVRDLRAVAVRVSDEAGEVFDIARAAYGHRSLQELLRPLLEAEARRLKSVPQVAAMLQSARELRAGGDGSVTALDPARRRGGGPPGSSA